MIQQSFILCAGKATRLYPITLEKPKCLLPVIDEQVVLDLIIDWLEKQGIRRHICNTFWKKELIREFVTNSGKNIFISEELDILGTFGGLVNALEYMDEKICVVYGDVVTNFNLQFLIDQHEETKADVTVLSGRSATPWTGGMLICDENNKITSIVEKPKKEECSSNLINAGIIIINKNIIEKYKNYNYFDIARDFLPEVIKDNFKVYQKEIGQDYYFIDMGTFESYEKLKRIIYDHHKNSFKN